MKCPTCGHVIKENFCSNCGEKKFDKHELTVKHFVAEALESFVHFDNKFLRSVKELMLKPGQLSLDFVEGRRVRFMKALQLFLVINLIYYFLLSNNPFALQLFNYVNYKPFTNYGTKELVAKKLEETHKSMGEFSAVFNAKMKVESKEFIFVFVVFYAAVFAVLLSFYKRTLAEHLTFATHFMTAYLIWSFVVFYLVTWPFYTITKIGYSQLYDTIDSNVTILAIFIYLLLAINRFYKRSFVWNLVCAAIIAGSFFSVLQLYRMALFSKIMHAE